MTVRLGSIRRCLEGAVPSVVATCAADGTPNASLISQVHYVDEDHVALSYQFFSKTRENVQTHPRATVQLVDPVTGTMYRLALQYLRTERDGPVFESMKAKLAGIASQVGMTGVFRLLGADLYRVLSIERLPGTPLPLPEPRFTALGALRATSMQLAACTDLASLFDETLGCLERHFDIRHAMLLMADPARRRLYTVASRGYADSGAGSEIPIGHGLIGTAAEALTAIRVSHLTTEYGYVQAVRDSLRRQGASHDIETTIALPGLPEAHSQLAVPIAAGRQLLGMLYVESPEELRFGFEDEDALATLAAQLASAIGTLQTTEAAEDADETQPDHAPSGAPVRLRRYATDDSLFLGDDYLIKGVAGAILWKLARDFIATRRTAFTNRELRLDPSLRLPDVSDNLEARLILLQRRLADRNACMQIEKTGRGRFRLIVDRPLELDDIS